MPAELSPRPDGIPLHTAFAAFRARFKTERFPQDHKEAFIGRVTGDFERLALHYFPTELGHFNVDGQTTIGSRYKNAGVEYQRTLHSLLGAVILTPTSENDIAQTTEDVRYQIFTHHQKTDKLSLENFQKVQRTMLEACPTDTDLGLLLTILSMHDTPKLRTVAERIEEVAGVTSINHDYLLGQMVQVPDLYKELAPSFAQLSRDEQQRAVSVMTSAYNRGQHAQAECSPVQLIEVTNLHATDDTLALIRAENTADLAGITGNLGTIYTNYLHTMYEVADESVAIVRGELGNNGILAGYIHILNGGLERAGVEPTLTPADFETEEGRRKITIAKCATAAKADHQIYDTITTKFDGMGNALKKAFIEVCTRTGFSEGWGEESGQGFAIMFYYFPALLEVSMKQAVSEDPENGLGYGIETALRLLAKISGYALDYVDNPKRRDELKALFSEMGVDFRGEQINHIPEFVFGLDRIVKEFEKKIFIVQKPKRFEASVEVA